MTESPFVNSGFVVPLFSHGDDLIAFLNKAMVFLTAVASSRFPFTNNQLRTSSNTRNQATIQDGRVTVQQVQGRQGQNYSGTTYKGNATSSKGNITSRQERVAKCYNCQGKGHIARQCTQPKRQRNAAWYKEKAMFVEAQEAGKILDEEQFTEDLDTYDSDCNDLSNAQAVLMANISNYGSDVISEATVQDTNLQAQQDSMILFVIEQMSEQMINHMNNREKANKEQNNESITAELERYKERVKTFEQHLNIDLSRRYQNPFYLKKAQRMKPTLYDGIIIFEKHVAMPMIDNEETLILEEDSRSKILTDDFGKRFTPQQELPAEHAFWLRISNPTIESSLPPIRVEVPSELPKKRTTPNALTEDLLNEITEVKTAFDQMEVVVQHSSVDKQCLEIANKELLLENDRFSQQIMYQDIVSTVMHCMSLNADCMNVSIQRSESCEKCLNLDAEFSKSKQE
nr:hypothetical protein [Tanacetum cinerariifolium]